MKKEHHLDYTAEDAARSESALLTVWATLRDFTEHMVLVGGLAPRYICRPTANVLQPVTMDVDLGVSLATGSAMYDTIKTRLEKAGFNWVKKRFVKTMGTARLFLDFLTDKPDANSADSVMVDDMPVSAVFGLGRALSQYREVDVLGKDLYGADVTERVKVCEAGPFICLKLQAYRNRAQSKDVFDFVRVVRDYDKGTESAIAAFHAESDINPAYRCARQTLEERFAATTSKGPMQYTDFCAGRGMTDATDDVDFLRQQYANEAVDAARLLMRVQ